MFSTGRVCRNGRLNLRRLILPLCMALLLGLVVSVPASACGVPPRVAPAWVIIDGNQVWIIVRGFSIHSISPGFYCGCAIRIPTSMATFGSADLVDRTTSRPVPGFVFDPSPGGGLAGYQNFRTPQFTQEAPERPAQFELVLRGTLSSGATFRTIAAALRQASDPLAAGVAEASGDFVDPQFVGKIDQVDPTNTSASTPAARVVSVNAGSPGSLDVALQDSTSGLSLVMVLGASQVTAEVGAFAPGTREPVGVHLALAEGSTTGRVEVKACSLLGRCSVSSFVLMPIEMGGEAVHQQVAEIDASQSRFHFQNGDTGLRRLALEVEGGRFSISPLLSGQALEGDFSGVLRTGKSSLTCSARGPAGSEGLLVFSNLP